MVSLFGSFSTSTTGWRSPETRLSVAKDSKMCLKARWWSGATAWIWLLLVSYFLPFGDWLARLRVWPPFLCSKFPKFSYLDVSTVFTRTTVLLQSHTSSQAWRGVPELCQGRVICKPRLQLQPSFLAFKIRSKHHSRSTALVIVLCGFANSTCKIKQKTHQIGELQYFHPNSLSSE